MQFQDNLYYVTRRLDADKRYYFKRIKLFSINILVGAYYHIYVIDHIFVVIYNKE